MLLEEKKENLIKELNRLRNRLGDDVSHLKKLRKEIKLSVKRLERKRKLPAEVEFHVDKIDQMILSSFFKAYLSILERTGEKIKEGSEESEREMR